MRQYVQPGRGGWPMNRRDFLKSAGLVSASAVLPEGLRLFAQNHLPEGWRRFEVTTRIEVLHPDGVTRVWAPGAMIRVTPFQRTLSNRFGAPGGTAELVERKADGLAMIVASFPPASSRFLRSQAGSPHATTRSISPGPGARRSRTARSCNISCGRPSSCPPTVS